MSTAAVPAQARIERGALTGRRATERDRPAMQALAAAAIDERQRPFLDAAQIAASHRVMGIDSQLIADGTNFVVEARSRLAGCGGWSRRAALIGVVITWLSWATSPWSTQHRARRRCAPGTRIRTSPAEAPGG
jgi:hypothetical protein